VRETLGICGRAYILVAGRVLEHGDRDAIASSEAARAAYLGEHFRL
jgi:lipopolysaccharide export system ATP-binding protein